MTDVCEFKSMTAETNRMYGFEDLLGTDDLCQLLHCSSRRIGWYRTSGLLPSRKMGRHWITTGSEYKTFLERTTGMDLGSESKVRIAGAIYRRKRS